MTTPNRSARDLGPSDLIWDFCCRSREESMLARVQPAAGAGYSGIGMFIEAWVRMRDNPQEVEQFEAALDDSGLVLANIETLRGWASPDGPDEDCLAREAAAWEIADRFESRYVQIVGSYTGTVEEAAIAFGALCDRASDHGLLVGLEAVPSMTNIDSLARAAQIVEAADRDNGGYCFDSWHLTRSTNNVGDISLLAGEKVFATQWSDGTIEPAIDDYYTDTLASRVVPGEGEFQLEAMVRALDDIGCTAPIGLEVPSTELWAAPIGGVALAAADGIRAVMASARAS